ncbi:hypothetical protein H2203_005820 [Taxawa tesnikishii (nom. ined.)]|nr:hypothetical protein H2203_005820 [Dothideales sp. JES 119]
MSYFDNFPKFKHNPTAPIAQEFGRLASEQGWKKKNRDKLFHEERALCYAMEFALHFNDDSKLANWQALCSEVGIEPERSITKCKKALSKVYVNLVDLIDLRRSGEPGTVRKFNTFKQLKNYTCKGKVFPKKAAKEDGYINVLLKHILH